jgi:hypothetical protein
MVMRVRRGVSESEWAPTESLPIRVGVTKSSQIPPLFEKEAPIQNTYRSGKNKNMGMGYDATRNQARLCWLDPPAVYWTGLWSWVSRDSDQRMAALARTCGRESAPYKKPAIDSNKNLVLGPKWVLDTKTDWPTDRRSLHKFDLNFDFDSL